MDEQKEIMGMLDLTEHPGFCVKDNRIVSLNPAARSLLLTEGTDISQLLRTGSREYGEFSGGCLYLTLALGDRAWGASVIRRAGFDVFILEQEADQAELRSMALAAQELREPLTNVMITADRLFPMTAREQDSQLQEQFARLNRGLYQMLRILGNMSDAVERRVSRQSICRITAVFSEIMEKAAALMTHAGITLSYEGPADDIYTMADPEQLERAVLNILSNAMKFSPAGSTVEAKLTQSGRMLRLTVSDSGCGIPDSLAPTLFRRHLREPGIEDSRFGLGLGMVLVRNAAAAHGGTVLIDRSPEGGTRVTLTLTLRQNPDPMLRSPVLRVDYAGERDHGLLELSEILPAFLYEKE